MRESVGLHARLRRVSWSPDDPAAADRLARDLVLVIARRAMINTSSPHRRGRSNRKVGVLSRQTARRIFFRCVAIEPRSRLFGSAIGRSHQHRPLYLPSHDGKAHLRHTFQRVDADRFDPRCCRVNFLFINSGHGAAHIRICATAEKVVSFVLVATFVVTRASGVEPVRDNRSRTGSERKRAKAARTSIFSAATHSFMDMIVVVTTSSAVLLCLMVAKRFS
jgi:hypothetical protein